MQNAGDIKRRIKMKLLSWAALFSVLALTAAPVSAQEKSQPKYSASVPPDILTPDTVQTRIGTLKFVDGLPDQDTVEKVYDQLAFGRGVEAFMSGMPAASVYAVCEGLNRAGAGRNETIAITEDLMDARSLFLTPTSTTVYVMLCIDQIGSEACMVRVCQYVSISVVAE